MCGKKQRVNMVMASLNKNQLLDQHGCISVTTTKSHMYGLVFLKGPRGLYQ